jgi:hypothetical protein
MTRQVLRVAMVGLAAALVATPAWADHVRVGSGFLGVSAVEYAGPRLFFGDSRGPIDFVGGTNMGPQLRPEPRGGPDTPRGRGNGNGNKKDKSDGFFGNRPTVVLPDVTAPDAADAGLGSVSGGSGPTATTPEPATLLLLGAGLGGALLHRARRRRAAA